MKSKLIPFYLFFLEILFVFISCSSPKFQVRQNPKDRNWQKEKLLLLPASYVNELAGLSKPMEIYEANTFVGFVYFSGGLVRIQKDLGVQTTTKNIELKSQSEFRKLSSDWIDSSISSLLRKKAYNLSPYSSKITFQKPKLRKDYSLSEDNGQDNINVPKIEYIFEELSKESSEALSKSGAKYAIIPLVQYYYGNNAGWFIGQDWGCMAGARIGVQILVYDIESKRVVADAFFDKKWKSPLKPSVNSSEYYQEIGKLQNSVEQDFSDFF
ncbi:hypothetical protein CH373_04455 [Leptospira perolatii]|uniref:Uncharacterized protein n=1 Tax=Leptospira perolatii TaxID=2023191 RepID=A0A2M9ZQ51_9LEPT|nr:hypothetical protein [Leptospira perolatii]PJZ68249.1 hypothetical protein CH360_17180 [Leptospira perolatii]PJZ74174.1 hypothetical protein CH373_04455 [Leptospira perolatii]